MTILINATANNTQCRLRRAGRRRWAGPPLWADAKISKIRRALRGSEEPSPACGRGYAKQRFAGVRGVLSTRGSAIPHPARWATLSRKREREDVGSIGLEDLDDPFETTGKVVSHVIVPKSQDSISETLEKFGSFPIVFRLSRHRVLAAIQLDDELRLDTQKIHDVRTNWIAAAGTSIRADDCAISPINAVRLRLRTPVATRAHD